MSVTEIGRELDETVVGIVCLTPEGRNSSWVLFEAGALSKNRNTAHVCTYLVGMDSIDVEPPLNQFHDTKAERDDTFKLVSDVNSLLGDAQLSETLLRSIFEKWWPDLEAKLLALPPPPKPEAQTKRKPDEILAEILETVRAQSTSMEGIRSGIRAALAGTGRYERAFRDAVSDLLAERLKGSGIGLRLIERDIIEEELGKPLKPAPAPSPPPGLGKKDEPKR